MRSSVLELLDVLEVDNSGKASTVICLHLHSHDILHVHKLVGHHALVELCVLWILSTVLGIEHHLHVWIHVDSLGWEAHLVLHHHSWELIHILHIHTVHHWAGLWHLVVSHLTIRSLAGWVLI